MGSPDRFGEQLRRLDLAVRNQQSFESLSGGTITPQILKSVVAELRAMCEFPIRPEPDELTNEPSLTPFGRTIELFGNKTLFGRTSVHE